MDWQVVFKTHQGVVIGIADLNIADDPLRTIWRVSCVEKIVQVALYGNGPARSGIFERLAEIIKSPYRETQWKQCHRKEANPRVRQVLKVDYSAPMPSALYQLTYLVLVATAMRTGIEGCW